MAVNLAGAVSVPRHAPVPAQIYFQGIDLTGGAVRAQVRLTAEAGGSPLIDLATVETAGAQGFRFVALDTSSAPYPISQFEMCINKATMEALPLAAEPDDDAVFAIDFHFTKSGGVEQTSPTVPFIAAAGVTR